MNKNDTYYVPVLRNRPWLVIVLSVVGWLLFLSLPLLMRPGSRHHNGAPPIHRPDDYSMAILHMMINASMIPLFYFQIVFIYPRTLAQKKNGWFFAAQVGLLGVLIVTSRLFSNIVFPFTGRPIPYIFIIMNYLFVMMIAYSYIFVSDNMARERREKEKENEALQAELTFLRWQISPHFLFNSLNNMVALARKRSDNLEPMLIQLSTLMRYMLYETDERKVLLSREADYLKSYIELQSLRFGNEIRIHTDIVIPPGDHTAIEPMLLIPFVENAFKHGTGMIVAPEITIYLRHENSNLLFMVKNKYQPGLEGSKDNAGGIGLANLQRRLNLLYPGRHELSIQIADGWYMATLNIDLA